MGERLNANAPRPFPHHGSKGQSGVFARGAKIPEVYVRNRADIFGTEISVRSFASETRGHGFSCDIYREPKLQGFTRAYSGSGKWQGSSRNNNAFATLFSRKSTTTEPMTALAIGGRVNRYEPIGTTSLDLLVNNLLESSARVVRVTSSRPARFTVDLWYLNAFLYRGIFFPVHVSLTGSCNAVEKH